MQAGRYEGGLGLGGWSHVPVEGILWGTYRHHGVFCQSVYLQLILASICGDWRDRLDSIPLLNSLGEGTQP